MQTLFEIYFLIAIVVLPLVAMSYFVKVAIESSRSINEGDEKKGNQ